MNALGFWVGSFATLLVTYDAIMVAAIVTVARPNIADVIFPFVLGLVEFLQFTVLTLPAGSDGPGPLASAQLSQIAWWPFVFAFATAAGFVNIVNQRQQLQANIAKASPELVGVCRWYERNLRTDKVVTGAATTLMLIAFVVLRWGWPDLRKWGGALGLMMGAGAAGSLRNTELGRRKFTEAFAPVQRGDPPPAGEAPLPRSDPPA